MTAEDPPPPERFSLSRWSRRKHAAARDARQEAAPAAAAMPRAPETVAPAAAAAPTIAAEASAPPPLPPVESLGFDSDFAPFMQPKVDEGTKRAALKKLFGDPRFNVMDGLDVYVDDYTKPDPLPAGMLDKLAKVYDALTGDEAPAEVAAKSEASPPATEPVAAAAPTLPEAAATPTVEAPLTPSLSPQAGTGSPGEAAT